MRLNTLLKLSVIELIFITGAGAAWYVFPIHFEKISGSLMVTGLIIAVSQLSTIVLSIPIGRLCDRFDRKKIILFGFLPVVFIAVLFATSSVYMAFAAMFLYGVFYSFEGIGMLSYLRAHSSEKSRGADLGTYQSITQAGWIAGPVMLSVIYAYLGLLSGFYMFSLAALAAAALSLIWLKNDDGRRGLGVRGIFSELAKSFRSSISLSLRFRKLGIGIAVLVFINFLTGFWEFALWVVEPLIASTEYSNLLEGSLVIAFSTLPFVVFGLLGGVLSDRLGRKPVILLSLALSFVSIFMFSVTTDAYLSIMLAFLASTGFAISSPAAMAFLTDIAPKNTIGLISGWEILMYNLAGFIAPLVSGFLGASYFRMPLLYTSFLVGVSVLLVGIFVRERKIP